MLNSLKNQTNTLKRKGWYNEPHYKKYIKDLKTAEMIKHLN
jgi:hypothetical protein